MRWALLVLSVATLAGVAATADEDMPESERIGPYELERVPEGLEIRSRAALGRRGVLAIAAGVCLVGGVVLVAVVASGVAGMVLAAVGLALAVAAALVQPGPDRVRVSSAAVVVEGFVGRQGTTSADAIGSIEVQRRTPTGAETKRDPRPRVWQITVRERSGTAGVVRFRLASREEADALAARIGEVLDRPVVAREGLAR
ncbi:MAG: hypothetical protein ACR2P8_05540 [Myxococcota bacterium]